MNNQSTGGDNRDYLDKAVDAAQKKVGSLSSYSLLSQSIRVRIRDLPYIHLLNRFRIADSENKFTGKSGNRATTEKITDFMRKQFEKMTGYDAYGTQ
ncbi:MAG: hypothetical protein LQ346_000291 [Caloplaca aetnensis]|nr:MAG: hypothetical protein LQ346_000291 [Caloplaca aetnensis]